LNVPGWTPGVWNDVSLYSKVPFIAFFSLAHLRIPCIDPTLRRCRCGNNDGVYDRAFTRACRTRPGHTTAEKNTSAEYASMKLADVLACRGTRDGNRARALLAAAIKAQPVPSPPETAHIGSSFSWRRTRLRRADVLCRCTNKF
jgi:hypothetical protein